MATPDLVSASPDGAWPRAVVDALPFAVAVLDAHGRIVESNRALVELCGHVATGTRCCDVLGCSASSGGCLHAARDAGTEALVALPGGSTAWATTRPTGLGGTLVCLRVEPVTVPAGDAAAPRRLLITTLGRLRVEDTHGGERGGPWLEQRPGQLLRYLVARRGRVVTAEEIAEALWADGEPRTTTTVRYVVHTLRARLEPGRPHRGASSFIDSHRGGYRLNSERVVIDADVFEREVRDGLAAHAAAGGDLAVRLLERATARHRGEFLSADPYADWAIGERERLLELHGRALRALADIAAAAGDLELAHERLTQLADLEPLDSAIQRDLIALCLRRGRRGEAVRRYEALTRRVRDAYGGHPGFALLPGPTGELAVA